MTLKLERNDPCHCGSGKKYKKCHLREDLSKGLVYYKANVSRKVNNLDELTSNTIEFIGMLKEIFNIKKHRNKGLVVEGSVTNSKVLEVYKNLTDFFPHNVNYEKLFRDVSNQNHTGIFWGNSGINSVANYISRYSLYTEKIIITNPFCDLMIYHVEDSPLKNPEPWIQKTMNEVLFLVSIEEWIKSGILIVIPPIKWFDKERDEEFAQSAKARIDTWSKEARDDIAKYNFLEMISNFAPEDIESVLKHSFKEVSPEMVSAFKKQATIAVKQNPLKYQWFGKEYSSSIIKTGSGNNLEATALIAELSNSFILFGEEFYKKHYDYTIQFNDMLHPDEYLTTLSRAFSELDFNFFNAISLEYILELRKEGKLHELRMFLNKLWSTVKNDKVSKPNQYQSFKDEMHYQYDQYKNEWKEIDKNLIKNLSFGASGVGGLVGAGTSILTGHMGWMVAGGSIAVLGARQIIDSNSKHKQHLKLPLGVFLKLDK